MGPSGTHNINDQNCSLLKLVEKLPEASGNFHRVQNILAKSRMFRKHLETSAELGMTLNKFEITPSKKKKKKNTSSKLPNCALEFAAVANRALPN